MSAEATARELIYLYCVTKKAPRLKYVEKLADKISFVYYQGLYAVVSKVKESEFSAENLRKNLADLEWVKKQAGIHEKIIEGIMKDACVVPFKFGTIFDNEHNLKGCLAENGKEFNDNLDRLRGREEWGVKIYFDAGKLRDFISGESEEILRIDKEIGSSPPGKGYFLKKKKEELLKKELNRKINECGQESFDRLAGKGLDARINKLLPREVTEREDDMILNSAFLIDKNKVKDFKSEVDAIKGQFKEMGLCLDCTGPWPPYNFCKISKEKAKNG